KNIVRAVLIVAVLNLLGVLGAVGWLVSSGRVTKDRLTEATALIAEDPAERDARLEAERLAAEPPPVDDSVAEGDLSDTQQRIETRVEMTMVDRERLERLRREVRDLQSQLRLERQLLERDREAFAAEQADFASLRQRLTEIEGAESFASALSAMSQMKAPDIKPVLTQLMDEGKSEEVISYLAAFEDRLRSKVVTEFVKAGEVEVAAGLLESLRTRGLSPADTGVNAP
ncbi:MAG: hypothetical protein AAGA55_09055, partial [Planctomycetota bacterium]